MMLRIRLVWLHVEWTTCDKLLVTPETMPSPAYHARQGVVPTGKAVVLVEATPLTRALVFMGTPLVGQVTLRVGGPAPANPALSVAVKVTFAPGDEGLGEDVKLSWLLALVMLAFVVGGVTA